MLQELTNKIKKILKDKEWTRLSLLEHGIKEYPEGYEHYEDIDITLEDVLMCLKSDYYINEDGYLYSIVSENEDGGIYLEMVSPGIHWQLSKPLHEQGEETIKELNKLICIK